MKHNKFYPRSVAQRPEWHTNLAAKLVQYGPTLGLTTAQVNNGVADNLYLAYGLGDWIINVREFAPSCTAILKTLSTGTGGEPFVFTPYAPPALPALPDGVTAVLPGALDRTFDLAQICKRSPGYTEAIGIDMGIVGSEAPPPPPEPGAPRITVKTVPGDTFQKVNLKFFKDGHEYVAFESRRGGSAWEPIGMANKSPFIDDRALLVAGQAEIREYRARFFDNNEPGSDWCAVEKVTVSP